MAVTDPRSSERFRGIGSVQVTFPTDAGTTITYDNTKKGGSAACGLAVTINSSGQVALTQDGNVVIGKLLFVNGDNVATVQIAGAMFLPPGASQTLTPGNGCVGALGASSAKGYIRQPAALSGSYVQTTQQDISNQRGRVLDTGSVNDIIQGLAVACYTVFMEG